MKSEEVKNLLTMAGFTVHAMWELPNGYWPRVENYAEIAKANPWWLVRTEIGCIQIGRRKNVWEVDWIDTPLRGKVTEELNVTSTESLVHAWTMPKLLEYLTALHALSAAPEPLQEGTQGLTPCEFSHEGISMRWYLKREVDAMLAAQPAAPAEKYPAVTKQQMRDNCEDIEIVFAAMKAAGRDDPWPNNMSHRINIALAELYKAQSARGAAPIAVQDDAMRDAAQAGPDLNPMEVGTLLNRAANYLRQWYVPTDHQWETAERMDTIANVFYAAGLAKRKKSAQPSTAPVETRAFCGGAPNPAILKMVANDRSTQDAQLNSDWGDAAPVEAAAAGQDEAAAWLCEDLILKDRAHITDDREFAEGRAKQQDGIHGPTWKVTPLYTRPPVLALTDAEISIIRCSTPFVQSTDSDIVSGTKSQFLDYARAILKAAKGEK